MENLNKVALLAALMYGVSIVGTAEEYISMLEDGMTWTCVHLDHYADAEPEYETTTVVGDTIINDKKCKKLIWKDLQTGRTLMDYAYEENGIVYDYVHGISDFLPYIDFSVAAEEWIGVYNGSGYYCGDYFWVCATEYVEIHGVRRKVIAIGQTWDGTLPCWNLWIEGIGSTYSGLTKVKYTNHGDFTTLLECTKNGECLFRREDIGNISNWVFNGEPIQYKPLIDHDRIWECIVREDNGDIHVDYLKFDDSEEFLGHTYTRIVKFASLDEHVDDNGNKTYTRSEMAPSTFGYMREENAEVFTIIDEESKIYTKAINSNPSEEVLIYKFNISEDDLFHGATFKKDRLQRGRFRVGSQALKCVQGENNKKFTLYFHEFDTPGRSSVSFGDRNFVLEGIGTGYYGCLCHPELDEHRECNCFAYLERGEEYRDHTCIGWDLPKYMTNRVFDKEGCVIYSAPRCNLEVPYQTALANVDRCLSDNGWEIDNRHISYISDSNLLELIIYSTDGAVLKKYQGTGQVQCDLTDIPNGVYIVVVKSNGVILSRKKICVT